MLIFRGVWIMSSSLVPPSPVSSLQRNEALSPCAMRRCDVKKVRFEMGVAVGEIKWIRGNSTKINQDKGWLDDMCVFLSYVSFSPKEQACLFSFVVCLYPFRLKIQDRKKKRFLRRRLDGRLRSSFESIMRPLPQVARFGGKWRPWRKASSGIIWRPSYGMKSSLQWLKHHEKQNTNSVAERMHLIHTDWLILTLIFKQQSHWARVKKDLILTSLLFSEPTTVNGCFRLRNLRFIHSTSPTNPLFAPRLGWCCSTVGPPIQGPTGRNIMALSGCQELWKKWENI